MTRTRQESATLLLGAGLGLIGLLGYGWWAATGGLVHDGTWIGVDFHVYYQTALVLSRGGDIYHAGIAPPYVYPPLLAALVVPLTVLPVDAATIAWKLVQHLCLFGAGALLNSLLPRGVRPLAVGVLLLGLLTVPVHDEIQVGESNSLVLLLEVAALWLIARRAMGRAGDAAPILAGSLLALAAGVKVLPVLLIAYFWWRGPRAVAKVATGAFLAIQAVSLLLIPATADYWLVQFPALFGQAFPFLDNQSINAALSRALLPPDLGAPALQLLAAPDWRPVLTWIANLVVLAGALLVLRPHQSAAADRVDAPVADGTNQLLLEVGFVLLTIHLVSGSTWMHHLVDLAVPLAGILGACWLRNQNPLPLGGEGRVRGESWVAIVLVGGFLLLLVQPADWVAWVVGLLPGWPLAAWLASNAGLWVILGIWAATARLLLAPLPRAAGHTLTLPA